ncbi:hypothetical protein [Scytonema sp. HK-05]|uniref:hypothetical protein n=1 Tax=Scytonema sp. HK-05 TaxID=1137095 RepID=UPI001160F2DA|nr:hypothetical protein [Scytonema sp. HK-05]
MILKPIKESVFCPVIYTASPLDEVIIYLSTLREALRVRSRLGRETLLQRCLTASGVYICVHLWFLFLNVLHSTPEPLQLPLAIHVYIYLI